MYRRTYAYSVGIVTAATFTFPFTMTVLAEQLPEGNSGIAAKYPGDRGITADPSVILADDFEEHSQKRDLSKIWNSVYNRTELTTETENVYLGNQAIEFSVPADRIMASGMARQITDKNQTHDAVFLRYYSKFAKSYDVLGGAHNGGGMSARMYNHQGRTSAGEPSNGRNHFAVELDHGRLKDFGGVANPGYLGIYIYHMGQRHRWGDAFFPNGLVVPGNGLKPDFGPNFVSRQNIVTQLGKWHCHEVMLRANTPGEKDGRVAAWVDGKLAMDFENIEFRADAALKIDRIQIGLNINTEKHPATKKWYDNIVAATSYIGPVFDPASSTVATSSPKPSNDLASALNDELVSRLNQRILRIIASGKWSDASARFAQSVWNDLAKAHINEPDEPTGHRLGNHRIDIEAYDDYLGSYGEQNIVVSRNARGRYVAQLGQQVMPAAATQGMIVIPTGDLVGSKIPKIGAKPYGSLEAYCIARVNGEYFLFRAHEAPTEHHRIRKQD